MSKFGFDLLLQQICDFVTGEFEWQRADAIGDSEIEKLLFLALLLHSRYGATEYDKIAAVRTEIDEAEKIKSFSGANQISRYFTLIVRPQAMIEGRRVDFLIHAYDWSGDDQEKWHWRKLIVECDGHDFHERTKTQAAKDRAKDRAAVMSGIDCFRFTGSEIWRDPLGCAKQITDWAVKGWG